MAFLLKQLAVPKGQTCSTSRGSSQSEPSSGSDPKDKPEVESDGDSVETLPAPPHSPSPEAEYDKLLVSKINCTDWRFCNLESVDGAVFLKQAVIELKICNEKHQST